MSAPVTIWGGTLESDDSAREDCRQPFGSRSGGSLTAGGIGGGPSGWNGASPRDRRAKAITSGKAWHHHRLLSRAPRPSKNLCNRTRTESFQQVERPESLEVGKPPFELDSRATWMTGVHLLEDIDLIRKLGEGGSGEVWLVRSRILEQDFAVKRTTAIGVRNRRNLLAELITWIGMPTHPNVSRLLSVFFQRGGRSTYFRRVRRRRNLSRVDQPGANQEFGAIARHSYPIRLGLARRP